MLDEALQQSAHEHRRRILLALSTQRVETGEGVSIPEDVHAGDTEGVDLHARLHHVHLPKLEEAGFIRWKRSGHHVFRGPAFDRVEPLLELLSDHAEELPDGTLQ